MTATMLVLALVVAPSQPEKVVTTAEKKDFLVLLAKLPTRREFYTNEAVKRAAPYTRVLLALTKKDIDKQDIYPFLALSQGLLERKEQREYVAKHFGKIAHPTLKLFWGAVLFDEKSASSEVVTFLRAALESKKQSNLLADILGPNFEDFKKRVKNYKVKER